MKKFKTCASLLSCGFLLLPVVAYAYVGPGAGLSLLGALWALIVAVAAALAFLFVWPIRRMRRRKREAKELAERERTEHARTTAPETGKDRPAPVPPQESSEPRSS
jgi:membrane protein implicated in regulation of membrane protease activity